VPSATSRGIPTESTLQNETKATCRPRMPGVFWPGRAARIANSEPNAPSAGTGFAADSHSRCPSCRGQFYTFVRLVQPGGGLWNRNPLYFDLLKRKLVVGQPIPDDFEIHEGYLPNVTVWTPAKRAIGHLLKIDCGAECRDGWYISVKTRCPVCTPTVQCPVCKGTGKFQTLPDDKTELFQAASELLGSDTDGLVATLEDFS